MIRECTLEDISDGRTYGLNDMVKADTGNCAGCFKCCTGMGTSIVLDPYDVCQIKAALNKSFQELLDQGYIELNMVDGLILPNLKMNSKNRCSFLSDEGRCTIHQYRPGMCRIFPLGRVYDGRCRDRIRGLRHQRPYLKSGHQTAPRRGYQGRNDQTDHTLAIPI